MSKSIIWIFLLFFNNVFGTLEQQNDVVNISFWEKFYGNEYREFSESKRLESKDLAKKMFYFGYENYMKHAFPLDELNPIDCSGRGPDVLNPLVQLKIFLCKLNKNLS